MRDDAVIAAADRADVAMVFTGTRHFRRSRVRCCPGSSTMIPFPFRRKRPPVLRDSDVRARVVIVGGGFEDCGQGARRGTRAGDSRRPA